MHGLALLIQHQIQQQHSRHSYVLCRSSSVNGSSCHACLSYAFYNAAACAVSTASAAAANSQLCPLNLCLGFSHNSAVAVAPLLWCAVCYAVLCCAAEGIEYCIVHPHISYPAAAVFTLTAVPGLRRLAYRMTLGRLRNPEVRISDQICLGVCVGGGSQVNAFTVGYPQH
jgi:hypothetical protein